MRARFKGDPERNGEGPEAINAFGLDFIKGMWVGVDDLDAVSLRKLGGNSHFEMDQGKASTPAPATPDEIPADWQKAHHKTRMKWATQVNGARPASIADADAVLTAHMTPKPVAKPAAQPAIVDPPAKGDDDWGDLDPDV